MDSLTYTPINAVTRKAYNGGNIVVLTKAAQALGVLSDPRWLTFLQAKALGLKVKKGSRGTNIDFWKAVEESSAKSEHSESALANSKKRLVRNFYIVFHASQVKGLDALAGQE